MVFSSKTLTVSVFTKENKWTPRKLSGKYREMRKGRGEGGKGRGGGFPRYRPTYHMRKWLVSIMLYKPA